MANKKKLCHESGQLKEAIFRSIFRRAFVLEDGDVKREVQDKDGGISRTDPPFWGSVKCMLIWVAKEDWGNLLNEALGAASVEPDGSLSQMVSDLVGKNIRKE